MFTFIRSMYKRGAMTAAQVWALADGVAPPITAEQATQICGPRPEADA